MKANYRHEARKHLKNAISSLEKPGEVEARSAALSLRFCMEALTYERARVYMEDLPIGKFEVWQPRKLMAQMLVVDPHADQEATISMGTQPSQGETPETMHVLGTEKPIKLKVLKKHYDALGSYLHMPTIRTIEKGTTVVEEYLRSRCEKIITELEWCLSSTLWSSSINVTASMDCGECGELIKRRFRDGDGPRVVSCHECGNKYTLKCAGKGKVHWHPHQQKIICPEESCKNEFYLPSHQIAVGREIDCQECNSWMRVDLGLSKIPAPDPK